jgi:sulfite reductase alpha subunit-like flavoprotein
MQFANSEDMTVVWPSELFTLLVQSLPKLQPRYFSIAFSPKSSPHRIAITVGVADEQIAGTEERFYGLTTNYLNNLHQQLRSEGTTHTMANRSNMPVVPPNAAKVLAISAPPPSASH